MIIIMMALVVSGIFLASVAGVARSRYGNGGVCVLSAAATVGFMVLVSPILALQSALTFVLAVICTLCRFKPRIVIGASLAAMAASFALALGMPRAELRERAKLREEFPLVSVSNRLAYEPRAGASADQESAAIDLAPDVERRLKQFEGRGLGNTRSYALSSLHDKTRDDFVMARGFGPVRMLHVSRERVQLPDEKPVPLPRKPDSPYRPYAEAAVPLAGDRPLERRNFSRSSLLSMHSTGLEEFLEPERFGYVKDRDHVAGFEPHRFLNMPRLGREVRSEAAWQVARLDLISLLKHEPPVAYVSENLPRMDELRDAPTRPLDAFERAALERLQSEEDLVIEEAEDRIRMVGALRAGKNCTSCHAVRRGELLGAFSYELTPMLPPRVKQPSKERPGPRA